MKIAICGSMTFAEQMFEIKKQLEYKNHEIILPHNTELYVNNSLTLESKKESVENKIKYNLFKYYFNLIKNSDAILMANFEKNKIKNYIGGNSFLEMGFAHILNKKIFILNDIPKMIYTDEIKAMQPIILKGDLTKIK
jgi:hypothetical protein